MLKNNLFKNRLFVYLLSLYLVGIIFGIIFVKTNDYVFNNQTKNYMKIFLSNYWYLFVIWLFGFSFLGYIVTSSIVFFRALVFGILVKLLIVSNFGLFIILLLLEILIFFPTLIFLAYISLSLSKENFKIYIGGFSNTFNLSKYINLMLVITVICALYSLLIYIN